MIEFFSYFFIVLAAVVFFGLILPIKFFINASGGTEDGIEISGRIMVFCGFIGGGLLYRKDISRLNIFLYSWRVFSINIKPLINYLSEKAKKRKEKERKPVKKKLSVFERIKKYYHKTPAYMAYFKTGVSEIKEIVRIDLFSGDIKIGLGNPALTGKIIGFIYFINGILPHPYVITPSWNFTEIAFQGKLKLKISVRSHILWKKLIYRAPLIISIIRRHKSGEKLKNNLIRQEV